MKELKNDILLRALVLDWKDLEVNLGAFEQGTLTVTVHKSSVVCTATNANSDAAIDASVRGYLKVRTRGSGVRNQRGRGGMRAGWRARLPARRGRPHPRRHVSPPDSEGLGADAAAHSVVGLDLRQVPRAGPFEETVSSECGTVRAAILSISPSALMNSMSSGM